MLACHETKQTQDNWTLTWLLVGDLREMLQDHLDDEALRWLRPVLDALIGTMRRQCELEQTREYFGDVLDSFPHLSAQVDAICNEQTGLCVKLAELRTGIDQEVPLTKLVASLEVELSEWVRLMTLHARRERELLQNVWYTELGGEG